MMDRLRSIRPPGIRMQLMLWYTSIFALLLCLFSVIFYFTLRSALAAAVDGDLKLRTQQIVAGITNDKGIVSLAEVTEDLPQLDTSATGTISTAGSSPASYKRAIVNFGTLIRILDSKGQTIYVTPAFRTLPVPTISISQPSQGIPWQGTLMASNGEAMRLYSMRIISNGALFGVIQVGESLTPLHTTLQSVVVKLLLIAPFILICGAIGSYWLAGRAFAPIRNLTYIAQDISAGDLDRRVPMPRQRDEVQQLALTFNQMIERLNQAFLQQRRFVADASHELRTPVAAIRSMTDVALSQVTKEIKGYPHGASPLQAPLRNPTLDECISVLQDVNAEAERLGWLIQNLLILARSDEGQEELDHEFVRLDLLVCDVVATLEALAVERWITLHVEKLEPVTVRGDTSRLIQCVMNLLDNALTYTDAGGRVTIQSEVKGNWGCIAIRDTGIGIAPEDLPHIFERFYRTDPARSQSTGGSGLGLSIVDWIIRVHGGSMHVESQLGRGSTFTMILPLANSS